MRTHKQVELCLTEAGSDSWGLTFTVNKLVSYVCRVETSTRMRLSHGEHKHVYHRFVVTLFVECLLMTWACRNNGCLECIATPRWTCRAAKE